VLRRVLLWLLGLGLIAQGINHFVSLDFFLRMMPAYLPAPALLVQLSGVAEVLLGAAVLVPRTRRLAGYGVLALLVAVFPANLEMALHPEAWPELPVWALYARLPFQAVFAAWVWFTCLRGAPSGPG
jgi:uncharacterized membrane protein